MKKLKIISLLFMAGLSLVALNSCEKNEEECCDASNPECPNYDPCLGQNPTSADFQFLAKYGNNPIVWIPETKFPGGIIKFSAVDMSANEYTWQLGADTYTDMTEIELGIGSLPIGSYSAKLVIEKEPNLMCFPEDQGVDSLTQFFDKVDFCDRLCLGEFKGISEEISNDSITIGVYLADPITGVNCEGTYPKLINVTGQQDTIFTSGLSYGTYSRYNFQGNGSGGLRGEIIVNTDHSVVFNYRLNNIDYLFTGRKL